MEKEKKVATGSPCHANRSASQFFDTYLFLESERDTSNWSLLDSLHQMSGVASNLVSKSLCLDNTDVVDDSLICMEVVGKPAQSSKNTLL